HANHQMHITVEFWDLITTRQKITRQIEGQSVIKTTLPPSLHLSLSLSLSFSLSLSPQHLPLDLRNCCLCVVMCEWVCVTSRHVCSKIHGAYGFINVVLHVMDRCVLVFRFVSLCVGVGVCGAVGVCVCG